MFCKKLVLIAVLGGAAINVRADFRVSFSAGVANTKFVNKIRTEVDIKDKLRLFHEILEEKWKDEVRLIDGLDYTSKDRAVSFEEISFYGFGIGAPADRNFGSVKEKIKKYLVELRNRALKMFQSSEGFSISDVKEVGFGEYEVIFGDDDTIKGVIFNGTEIHSAYLKNKYVPSFSAQILKTVKRIRGDYFSTYPRPLENAITDAIAPNETEIIQAWDAATNPPAVKRNGLTLGLSVTYAKSLFPKISAKYGFYTGAEGFAEFNPNASKSNGFSVKEHSFGIRPFAGIIKEGSWAVYGLFGVKCAKRKIQSEVFHSNKGSLSYELGVGTDYFLSDRFSVSAKFIKGLRSKVKMKRFDFQISSTKILLCLNYHF